MFVTFHCEGLTVQETQRLREALAKCSDGNSIELLQLLGFEPIGLDVPREALADFGLDPAAPLALEVAARHSIFHVFRVTFRGALEPDLIHETAAALYRHNPTRL